MRISLLIFLIAIGIFFTPFNCCFAQQDSIEIIDPIEKWPVFLGGEEALFKFLEDSIKYPQNAIDAGIEGTVHTIFIVERDGSITNVKILRGIGYDCDEEAIRLVSSMPNWIPGTIMGKPVRIQFMLPVKFTLPEE